SQRLAFSPDGRQLAWAAAARGKTVRLWDTRSGQEARTFTCRSEPIRAMAFSPDGTRLAVAAGERDGVLQVWDLARGDELTIDSDHCWAYGAVAFSPDGTRLLAAHDDFGEKSVLKSWDVKTGRELSATVLHVGVMGARAFSADGSRLAAMTREAPDDSKWVSVWDAVTGAKLAAFPSARPDWPVLHVAFSGDGARVVVAGDHGAEVMDSATGELVVATQSGSSPFDTSAGAALSPDGKRLVTGGPLREYGAKGEVTVWDTDAGEE